MKKPLKFKCKQDLINFIALTMPDMYPDSMAKVFAEEWLKEKRAIITNG